MNKSQYKQYKTRIKKQRINIIFNYSSTKLTQDMENVLNKGLNFCNLQSKLDLTQILTDFKRVERTIIRKEFWYGRETDHTKKHLYLKVRNKFA